MVQRQKVNEFRRIFCVGSADILNYNVRNIFQFLMVIPQLIKKLHVLLCEGSIETIDHIVSIITTFTTNVYRCKTVKRHVSSLRCTGIHRHEAAHVLAGRIGFESYLSANPVCTLFGNSTLRHFIAKLDFKFCSI